MSHHYWGCASQPFAKVNLVQFSSRFLRGKLTNPLPTVYRNVGKQLLLTKTVPTID